MKKRKTDLISGVLCRWSWLFMGTVEYGNRYSLFLHRSCWCTNRSYIAMHHCLSCSCFTNLVY